jgi:hypothetical protein
MTINSCPKASQNAPNWPKLAHPSLRQNLKRKGKILTGVEWSGGVKEEKTP